MYRRRFCQRERILPKLCPSLYGISRQKRTLALRPSPQQNASAYLHSCTANRRHHLLSECWIDRLLQLLYCPTLSQADLCLLTYPTKDTISFFRTPTAARIQKCNGLCYPETRTPQGASLLLPVPAAPSGATTVLPCIQATTVLLHTTAHDNQAGMAIMASVSRALASAMLLAATCFPDPAWAFMPMRRASPDNVVDRRWVDESPKRRGDTAEKAAGLFTVLPSLSGVNGDHGSEKSMVPLRTPTASAHEEGPRGMVCPLRLHHVFHPGVEVGLCSTSNLSREKYCIQCTGCM